MKTLFTVFLALAGLIAPLSKCAVGEQSLKLSIAIPHTEKTPGILHWDTDLRISHFSVILTNGPQGQTRIFQEWCSWGYHALSFELVDEHGKKWVARKGMKVWTMNGPGFWTLNAGEMFAFTIAFSDRSVWGDGFWLPPGHPSGEVTLTAIYEVRPDSESKERGVWTGRIVSDSVKCIIK